MTINNKVVWSEGLLLSPQHLQQQERYLENYINQRHSYYSFHTNGIGSIKLDENLINQAKVSLIYAKGIFPDGTPFNICSDDAIPTPIDIPAGITDCRIFLALPLKSTSSPEVTFNEEQKNFFRCFASEMEVFDNTLRANSNTLQVSRLGIRLMLETEDRGGYTCIPILKIKESLADKIVKIDEQFIPTVLDINAASRLSNFLQELFGLLHHRGDTLVSQMTDTGYGGASEIADFMLLQLINRYEPLLEFLINNKKLHPQLLYLYLIQLMGELSTFTASGRRVTRTVPYDHDNLQICFDPIIRELRQSLSIVIHHSALSLTLEPRKRGVWVSTITDRHLLDSSSFVLAVNANIAPDELRSQFVAQVKVASVETINALISRSLPGIDLLPLVVVPRQIPFHSGYIYYTLNKNHEYWKDLSNSGGIAIHVGNEFPGLALQLWAIQENA